jgi:type IV secretory pathway VirB10-like protein
LKLPSISATTHVIISAGQELTAVLTESVNSDYPSVAKATLTSPAELSGATVLLSYSLGNERVTAQILKMILPAKEGEKAMEMTLSAVVKTGLPGLTGDVSHHWTAQIASGLASAGLTAGALAYASQNSSKDLGTAVLVAPMVEQSVQGVLKPINYLGRDRPVTVTVPAGTEFTILVTEGFEVDL